MAEFISFFSKVHHYSEQLDTKLRGLDYLNSPEKSALDKFGARLLFVSWPALLAVRGIIRIQDGGPTVISLPRMGKDGEIFKQHKLRTMRNGSEVLDNSLFEKLPDDPRITPIGRYLRAWSVDEVPQARNILVGEMSLVGPRPKSIQEVAALSNQDPDFYTAYTSARPGLTGLEQIHRRGAATSDERIELAKEYAAEASLALDVDIIKKTIGVVASRNGAY